MTRDKTILPAGEWADMDADGRRIFRMLASGQCFKYDTDGSKAAYSYTSSDRGRSWQRGGALMPYRAPIQGLRNAGVQMQSPRHAGRIVLPFYLQLNGQHPDYTRQVRGGYAIYRGEKILLETHTHVPEMAGAFMVYSDDEGASWQTSDGFLVGYFNDGHMGFFTCNEPAVVELSDGRLLCYMRSTCGRILESESRDGGRAWSKVAATDLAMSNSPCALARIPGSLDLVLVWNQVSSKEIQNGFRRGRLSMAISRDDGQSWECFKTLELVSGLSEARHIAPPPLASMIRGPSGPDQILGEVPDDMRHFGYPEIYFHGDHVSICYKQHEPGRPHPMKWKTFSLDWLYSL